MQRRYKGHKIPTFEELLQYRSQAGEILAQYNMIVPEMITYPIGGLNVNLFTLNEAYEIKEEIGMKGLNEKIDSILVDFIDNVYEGALTLKDSVTDMELDVNKDKTKQFKDMVNTTPNMLKEVDQDTQDKLKAVVSRIDEITLADKESEEPMSPETRAELDSLLAQVTSIMAEIEASVKEEQEDEEESEEEEDDEPDPGKLTDEQVDQIIEKVTEVAENSPEYQAMKAANETPITPEKGEFKKCKVEVDPNTGEQKMLSTGDILDDEESFDEMVERISAGDIEMDVDKHIGEEDSEIAEKSAKESLAAYLKDSGISPESLKQLISLANRKIDGEKFPIFNSMPDDIKKMINDGAKEAGIPILDNRFKAFRNEIAENLLDDFISNISLEKTQKDFNSEIEQVFAKATDEISEEIVGYTIEKMERYREAAEQMEDPEKKEKLLSVLDRIQEAYDLNELKEFAKRCKIKKFDLEKPERIFEGHNHKYENSQYNTYSIQAARPVLYRNLNKNGKEEYTDKDINAFFIAYCKQTMNMSTENILEHSYMYYVIYNIVLADINTSESTKHVSETFLENVKEVIANLKSRNSDTLQ